ncbi:MAG: pyruvate kinase [Armatimonadetes bacterium]|nr:pyruvate kinase [Armatimonadota bacterium]
MLIRPTKTKIICTVGPASEEPAILRAMLDAGMDLARLNFSHGNHDWHAAAIRRLRELEAERGVPLGIIADLQGPRIRVGKIAGGKITLTEGEEVDLVAEPVVGCPGVIPSDYEGLAEDVQPGARILLDDGLLELKVLSVSGKSVRCRVVTGGELLEHKGMNLPGVAVSAPALTDKDREDLQFALASGVDYVALSFVQHASDIVELRALIEQLGGKAGVIAKLEKPEALAELDDLIRASDAVMVARGDLGVEMAPERVPLVQKQVISRCMAFRVPVITATQMLDSMREHPRPTRAEVADVANAILDGTDAVMLSGETSAGRYPVESVRMMERIVREAEQYQAQQPHLQVSAPEGGERLTYSDAVARAAAQTAEATGARLIVAFTQSGWTARLVSKCRSAVPAVAATPEISTARRCALFWGITPVVIDQAADGDEMVSLVERMCHEKQLAAAGDTIVVTSGAPVGVPGTTNLMRLHKLGAGH